MVRKALLRICLIIFGWISLVRFSAQEVSPVVIGSAGESIDFESFNFSFTVGETAIFTLENEGISLLQGFHQPNYFLDVKVIENDPDHLIQLYPNPTDGLVEIKFPAAISQLRLDCLDLAGKTLFSKKVNAQDNRVWVNTLEAGVYVIRLRDQNSQLVFRAMLIKI